MTISQTISSDHDLQAISMSFVQDVNQFIVVAHVNLWLHFQMGHGFKHRDPSDVRNAFVQHVSIIYDFVRTHFRRQANWYFVIRFTMGVVWPNKKTEYMICIR